MTDGPLQVQLLHPDAVAPARTRAGDAGHDLRAVEGAEIPPDAHRVIPTGIAIALPPGIAGLVTPRSGLAAQHGITLVNTPGLIDPNYRGEIKVILRNEGARAVHRRARRPHRPAAPGARSGRPRSRSSAR